MRDRIRQLYAAPLLTILTKAKAKPNPPFSSVTQALETALKEKEVMLAQAHSSWAQKGEVSAFLDYGKQKAIINTANGFSFPALIDPRLSADVVVEDLLSDDLLVSPQFWAQSSRVKIAIECAAYLLPAVLEGLNVDNKQVPDLVLKLQSAAKIVEARLWQEYVRASLPLSLSLFTETLEKPDKRFQTLMLRSTGVIPSCEKKLFSQKGVKASRVNEFFSESRQTMMFEIALEDEDLFKKELLRPFGQ